MFANDPITPDPPPSAVQISTLLWISIAAFVGVGVGALPFGDRTQQPDATQRSQSLRRDPDPSPPEPQPHAIVETRIARKTPAALRAGGSHRFAVFNAGNAVLKMARSGMSNRMSATVPPEIAPGHVGYVTIAWSPFDDDSPGPKSGMVEVFTNDWWNKKFLLVVAEDPDSVE
ncbi:MAG TPA: hypothetical protein VGM05_33265 [Planctomycetaceae bacterium]|jgi:hypothetical protein